jgi:hypothetical protein
MRKIVKIQIEWTEDEIIGERFFFEDSPNQPESIHSFAWGTPTREYLEKIVESIITNVPE